MVLYNIIHLNSQLWQIAVRNAFELCFQQELLRLWKHECKRVIADRFTVPDDVTWFDKALVNLVEEEFGEEKKLLVDCGVDAYFVDFLRDAPEATGERLKQNLEFPKGKSEDNSFSLGMLHLCLVNYGNHPGT